MVESLYVDLKLRHDLKIIADLVQPGHRVLDLGCGDGSFLKMLRETRGADILGMEIEHKLVAQCIANGVPVIQSDLNDELDFAEENSFDLVILSQTLQQVKRPDRLLRRIVRSGAAPRSALSTSAIFTAAFSCCSPARCRGRPRSPTSGTTRRTSTSAPSGTFNGSATIWKSASTRRFRWG